MPNTAADSQPAPLHVAVAVVLNASGDILLTRRHPDKHQGGLWEFPGGKVETGESLGEALHRELLEEIGISTLQHEPLLRIEHDYGDKQVLLDVHRILRFSGEPQPREGQPMRWVAATDLQRYEFPAANRAIIDALVAGEASETST